MIRLIILILLLASLNGMGQTLPNDSIKTVVKDSMVVTVVSKKIVVRTFNWNDTIRTYKTYKVPLTSVPPNQLPICSAGANQTIMLPLNGVTLTGTATDNDGNISSVLWSRISGPTTFTLGSPNNLTTLASGLVQGTYTFRLTSTDNDAGVCNSNVTVTVTVNPQVDTSHTGYSLVYNNGFNTLNDIDPCDHGQWGGDAKANHLSTTIFKTGPGSFLSKPSGNVSSGIRSEVQLNGPNDATCPSPLEGIAEWDVYYDNFFCNSGHSIQIHPATQGGSGTGLYHVGCNPNRFDFVSVEQGETGTHYSINYTVPTKKWIHIKMQYKWGNNGYMNIDIDGVRVCTVANKKIGDGSSPDWKIGTNMWQAQTSVIYYDNFVLYKKN